MEGERGVAGRNEEAVVMPHAGVPSRDPETFTHERLLREGRALGAAMSYAGRDHVCSLLSQSRPPGLVAAVAPLLQGARLTLAERFDAVDAPALLESGTTVIVSWTLTLISQAGTNLPG